MIIKIHTCTFFLFFSCMGRCPICRRRCNKCGPTRQKCNRGGGNGTGHHVPSRGRMFGAMGQGGENVCCPDPWNEW